MNPDYQTYSVEDFARDEHFRQWVIHRDPQSEAHWQRWLKEYPHMAGKVQLARSFLFALEEKNTALPAEELDHIAATITQHETQVIRRLWPTRVLAVAASIAVVLGIGYVFLVRQPQTARQDKVAEISPVLVSNFTEVETPETGQQRITLEDGSTVLLYANSRLRYPKQFTAGQREVYLSGKAFFTITKNPKRPFWVHADRLSTQVLGTSFLVSTEGENPKVEVRSGRVSVYTRKDMQQARQLQQNESVGVVLTANQKVTFIEKEDRLVKSVVQQPVVLRPVVANEYIFDEAPIAQVFDQLEATYGLAVTYDPMTVKNCFITANLAGEGLFEKLNLVCLISRSTYEIVDGQIIIHSNGCDNS